MTIETLKAETLRRLRASGCSPEEDEALALRLERSARKAADYCNYDGFQSLPPAAEFYVADYAAAEYLIENGVSILAAERLLRDAETGLLRFRRIRW